MPVAMSGAAPGYASTSVAPRTGEPFEYRVTIGALGDVAALKHAIDAGDDATMGRLLGFPPCCITFFRHVWVNQGCVDTTWPMAAASGQADRRRTADRNRLDTPFEANILWRWMGVRAVPHLPCSFACRSTVQFADTLMALGRELGYAAEMGWMEEILNWPASWSALHGIAEVKTPILKASTRTDATSAEFVVRRPGLRVPPEAATGLVFPFRSPELPGITHSLSFRRGLEAPIAPQAAVPPWYATDNGFNSATAMDEAHRPLVELALTCLGESGRPRSRLRQRRVAEEALRPATAAHSVRCGRGRGQAGARAAASPGVPGELRRRQHVRSRAPRRGHRLQHRLPHAGTTARSRGCVAAQLRLAARPLRASARVRVRRMAHAAQRACGPREKAGLRLVSQHASGAAGLARFADCLRSQTWRPLETMKFPGRRRRRRMPPKGRRSSPAARCCAPAG